MSRLENQNMRDRIEKLWETDRGDEDSVKELAKAEDGLREIMESSRKVTDKKTVDALANYSSDKILEQMEKKIIERREANTDHLTGLYNLKSLKERIPKSGDALLMIDIDYFKKINDTYGHPAGDKVLAELGKLIREKSRKDDIAFRYGGEEFAIFLSHTDIKGAEKVAEKIRKAVENDLRVKIKGSTEPLKITISVGCASTKDISSEKEASLESLIAGADRRLYYSKNSGRNMVTAKDPDGGK